MQYRKFFSVLLFVALPILALAGPKELEKKIIGKWQLKTAMSAGKRSFKSDDITNRYKGNSMTFFDDKTMEFYRGFDSTTFKGTWEISQGERHKVNPQFQGDRNFYFMLDMELNSGVKSLRIDGKMLKVGKKEMEYKEYKGDLNYWFLYEKVE